MNIGKDLIENALESGIKNEINKRTKIPGAGDLASGLIKNNIFGGGFFQNNKILSGVLIGVVGIFLIASLLNVSFFDKLLGNNKGGSGLGDLAIGKKDSPTRARAGAIGEARVGEITVQRVVDGDTIETGGNVKIRFLNMDTPETVKPNTPVKCWGPEAKARTKELILGKTIYTNFDKEPVDKYGRELNFLYLNKNDAIDQNIEKSVNATLVKEGFARASFYSPNTTFRKDFDGWQGLAIEKKLGVWKNCSNPFNE